MLVTLCRTLAYLSDMDRLQIKLHPSSIPSKHPKFKFTVSALFIQLTVRLEKLFKNRHSDV